MRSLRQPCEDNIEVMLGLVARRVALLQSAPASAFFPDDPGFVHSSSRVNPFTRGVDSSSLVRYQAIYQAI